MCFAFLFHCPLSVGDPGKENRLEESRLNWTAVFWTLTVSEGERIECAEVRFKYRAVFLSFSLSAAGQFKHGQMHTHRTQKMEVLHLYHSV